MLQKLRVLYYTNKELDFYKLAFNLTFSVIFCGVSYALGFVYLFKVLMYVLVPFNTILIIILAYSELTSKISQQEVRIFDYLNRHLLYREYDEYRFVNKLMDTRRLKTNVGLGIPIISNIATMLEDKECKNYLIDGYIKIFNESKINYKDITHYLELEVDSNKSDLDDKLTVSDKNDLNMYGLKTVKSLKEFNKLIKDFERSIKEEMRNKNSMGNLVEDIDRKKVKEYVKELYLNKR